MLKVRTLRTVALAVRTVSAAVLLFFASIPVSAQAVDAVPDSQLNPIFTEVLDKAEALFATGEKALATGNDAEARDAFDGVLDLFVAHLGSERFADSTISRAYEVFVDRIHAAEVAAGNQRRVLPPSTFVAIEPVPNLPVSPQASGGTLADLGVRIEQLTPTEEARETSTAVLVTETNDLPIEMNDQVLGAINLYSGRFRSWFSRALSRGQAHLPRIREILAEAGIPQDLAYVPIVESAFNPTALSRAKAKGVWQFIPSTGKQYGLRQDFFVDERSNIEKATLAAAQYLKYLYAMFGDWNLALAGYNAGEGRVMRAIKRSQTNDFWALAKTKSFRSETKNYVPLIHAAIVIAKSPESYGIDLTPDEVATAETVQVSGSYAISTVARCAETEPTTIRTLNPELRRGLTPATPFELKVPHGAGEKVTACLAGERSMSFTRHVVRKRDTLAQISKMFGVPAAEIARVNGISLRSRLRPGTELAVPRAPRPIRTVATGRMVGSSALTYKIRKGDTLSEVAARFGTTVNAIKTLNGLRSSRLSIGQVLRVSTSPASATTSF